jgi:DMSO/TMAO reductase YedYZ molybdopterin-dependent catalytic subunit
VPTSSADRLPPGQQAIPALKVKHYGRVPRGEAATWRMLFLQDLGAGRQPSELGRLTAADLEAFPQSRVTTALHCASGWSTLDVSWKGVPAAAVFERFPPAPGTVGLLAYAEYGYSTNLRISDLLRPTTLLAIRLDDQPLPPDHGHPVRLVVPHLYAHKSPKWFRGWEYLVVPRRGFWEERGYHLIGDPWQEQRYSYLE